MTDPTLPIDIQQRLDEHLDAVDEVLRKYNQSRTERSAIVDELANQIIEMLTARSRASGGGELSMDDLDAVLSEIDPPEAYADSTAGPSGTSESPHSAFKPKGLRHALWPMNAAWSAPWPSRRCCWRP